jgi:hypothetical protein
VSGNSFEINIPTEVQSGPLTSFYATKSPFGFPFNFMSPSQENLPPEMLNLLEKS